MRLTRDVHLVGGGDLGFNLSHPNDAHVYAIRSGDEVALLDVGVGIDANSIVSNLRDDGIDPRSISKIFVTHYHADHAGGLNRWARLTGAAVHVAAAAAEAIRVADGDRVGLRGAQRAGVYPADYVLEPCAVDVEIKDGDAYLIGQLRLTAIDTPGHCDGHTVFRVEGGDRTYLFSGDCLLTGGTVILQNIPDCDIPAYVATVERLAQLEFDAFLPGHLGISLRDGQRHVAKAMDRIRLGRLPKQALESQE